MRASGRHQDLGRRLAVDRQHRPVLSVPGHRRHAHHRCGAGVVRARELHPRTARPRSSRPTSRWAGRWPATCRATTGVDTILDVYEEALHETSAHRPPAAARARRRDHATNSCSGPPISASRAASSSTRSTTGVTSSSTACSGPSTDRVGCHAVPRSRPACASRCTTIRRSRPRSRCATSASRRPGWRRAGGCWRPRSG